MAHPRMRFTAVYEAGEAWLADCSTHPDFVREAWHVEALAPIPSGTRWLAAETLLVTGMQARSGISEAHRGPVLADPVVDRAWWLVPLNASDELADLRPVTVRPVGWPLHCPPTGRQACSRFWLTHPDGSGLKCGTPTPTATPTAAIGMSRNYASADSQLHREFRAP
ncbi:hypothetical protein [Streptomyces sp. NPDC005799]|uniref:hypothetical protein n=1 Tax=Streptomyces sp. NPDC005799 TaxID=3154678 RepID=UPI0033F0F51F